MFTLTSPYYSSGIATITGSARRELLTSECEGLPASHRNSVNCFFHSCLPVKEFKKSVEWRPNGKHKHDAPASKGVESNQGKVLPRISKK